MQRARLEEKLTKLTGYFIFINIIGTLIGSVYIDAVYEPFKRSGLILWLVSCVGFLLMFIWISNLIIRFFGEGETLKEREKRQNILYKIFKDAEQLHLHKNYSESLSLINKLYNDDFLIYHSYFDRVFYSIRASCYQAIQDDNNAILNFKEAIKYNPKDCNLYYCLSLSYLALKNYEKEIGCLKIAINLANEHTNDLYNERAKQIGFNTALELYSLNLYSALERLKNRKKIETREYIIEYFFIKLDLIEENWDNKEFFNLLYESQNSKDLNDYVKIIHTDEEKWILEFNNKHLLSKEIIEQIEKGFLNTLIKYK